ncbi:MAG: thioredoxin family protein [Candidatus Neomarinimicrobiota bacterium]
MKSTSAAALLLIVSLPIRTLLGGEDVFMALSFKDAVELAEKENKTVVVKFHADWCHWCQLMDSETFTDEAVVNSLQSFIVIRVNVDSREGLKIAQRVGVVSIPTIVFLDGRGEVVGKYAGFRSPVQMKELLTAVETRNNGK